MPADEHDVLTVLGDVQLAGTLSVGFINAFAPMLGDEFTIVTFTGTRTGLFQIVDCSMWEVIYNPNDVTIRAVMSPLLGDLNCDGNVGILDFLILLAAWGSCPDPPDPCPADLDDDGEVGIVDFLLLLPNWTL